jgi:SpoIID/LytB domain protein
MSRVDARWVGVAVATWLLAVAVVLGRQSPAPAYFIRSLDTPTERRESRSEILDTPVLPGSIMKAVTLVAALESGVIEPDTRRICRRVVTIDGQRFSCAHPDLRRPLSAAEALAHSCNDFFTSLAPRLPRQAFNDARMAAGLPPVGNSVPLAAALVGLDGPRVTPRALLDVLARIVAVGPDPPARMRDETRAVLRAGLAAAATYGSASLLGAKGIAALAKTGTAPMPGGGVEGLLVALVPAERPVRGIVVVAPGAAGFDAAGIAADLLLAPPPTVARTRPAPPVTSIVPAAGVTSIRLGMLQAEGRTRIESVPLEDYVARVLAGEGQPRAADAAQEALAIAIRTFALANRNRHRREGFDLCDSTHCQVVRAPTATTRRAAEATAGRVLLSGDAPAFIFYSAWCGGRSARPSEVWPGAEDYAFEPSLRDTACTSEPPWESEVNVRDIERALRSAGLRGSRLRDLRILARSASGRVARLRVEGFTPNEIAGHELRMAIGRVVGWQHVKSAAFDLRRTGRGYRFAGRGFGHGVGLCVVGAGHRAAAGASAEDILRFYYPGLQVRPSDAIDTALSPLQPAVEEGTASVEDVQLALPAIEAAERPYMLGLLRAARDEIAKRAGLAPPTSLRVTVHPSVESFGRATGQPWWASGATLGTAIDLLPLAVLRRQGQLEGTIRHEMAHAIVDPLLASRPLWVREGAAFYFAAPHLRPPDTGRVACPTDDELLRPLSAGAQREAYARAEACFRKAIADGKSWRDVR